MNALLAYLKANGTKVWGVVIAGVSTALAMNLIPPKYAPWANWFLAVSGAGVLQRGFGNTAAIKAAVAAQVPPPVVPTVQPPTDHPFSGNPKP